MNPQDSAAVQLLSAPSTNRLNLVWEVIRLMSFVSCPNFSCDGQISTEIQPNEFVVIVKRFYVVIAVCYGGIGPLVADQKKTARASC